MNGTEYDIITCSCGTPEHHILVARDCDEDGVEVLVLLDKPTFWRRVRAAFGYVTGWGEYPPQYAEVLLGRAQIDGLIHVLSERSADLLRRDNRVLGQE